MNPRRPNKNKKIMKGINFEGDDKFTLKELNSIKNRVKRNPLTMKEFILIMGECESKYAVSKQIAFNVVQYCVMNRNG